MASSNRQRIIDAACRLFIEGAFHNTGVADICKIAGVNKGTLYHFFGSKSEVLVAAIADHTDDLVTRFKDTVLANEEPLARLRGFFRLSKQYSIDYRHKGGSCPGCLLGNLSGEISASEVAARQVLRDAMKRLLSIVEDAIQFYYASKAMTGDSRKAAYAFMGMLQGAHVMARLNNDVSTFDVLEASIEGIVQSYKLHNTVDVTIRQRGEVS